MDLNLSSQVRKTLYVLAGVLNIVVGYFALKGLIGDAETASWALLNTFIAGLARFNVTPDNKRKSL